MGDVESIPGVDEEVENLGLASSLRQRLLRAQPIGEDSASVPDELHGSEHRIAVETGFIDLTLCGWLARPRKMRGFSRSLKISSRAKGGRPRRVFSRSGPPAQMEEWRWTSSSLVVSALIRAVSWLVRVIGETETLWIFFWLNHSRALVDRQDAGHHACCSRPRAGASSRACQTLPRTRTGRRAH